VGGIQLLDRGEADDKMIAILDGDLMWNEVTELQQLPKILVERLEHYFSTYKLVRGVTEAQIKVPQVYGADYAARGVAAAIADYQTLVA